MSGFLSPIGTPTQRFLTDGGIVLAGGLLYTYLAGTTTPASTYTSSSLSVANPNPIQLNSYGSPPQEIWLQGGVAYKFVITDANNDPLSVSTFDNVTGINDTTFSGGGGGNNASEWQSSGLTPTYVNGTQFTVPGNQTTVFSQNRRVQATVSAGTIYGTVSASSFGSSNTTVTVVWDAGALDSGLSQISFGILNPTNPSYLSLANVQVVQSTGPLVCTNGATKARVRMVGGGGAGGGSLVTTPSTQSTGGGGASGDYVEFMVVSGWQALAGTTLTIGAAGTANLGTTGGNGGNTTFGTLATANGGQGGIGGGSQSFPYTATDLLNFPGVNTAFPSVSSPLVQITAMQGMRGKGPIYWAGEFEAEVETGSGGSNPLGSGGELGYVATLTNHFAGANATGWGAGGSGAISLGNNTNQQLGGAGGAGVMIIEEFL